MPGTRTIDAVDLLVEKINENRYGIEFVRDAWLNKAPENYGVAELNGEPEQLWADGHLIDSVWRVVLTLYVKGADDSYPAEIQGILETLEMDGILDTTHTISRSFDMDTGKVRWTWQISLYGPLERTVAAEEDDD